MSIVVASIQSSVGFFSLSKNNVLRSENYGVSVGEFKAIIEPLTCSILKCRDENDFLLLWILYSFNQCNQNTSFFAMAIFGT